MLKLLLNNLNEWIMKKSLTLLMAIILVTGYSVLAQKPEFGITAGMNVSNWRGETSNAFNDLMEGTTAAGMENKTGLTAGLWAELPIDGHFSIESGLIYSSKGNTMKARIIETGLLNINAKITNHAHYLETPLHLKYQFPKGFFISGGPQVAYLLKNEIEARAGILGFSVGERFDLNNTFRKWDFGLSGGIGYEFVNGFQLKAVYDYGLSPLDDTINADVYNQSFKFSVGYRLK